MAPPEFDIAARLDFAVDVAGRAGHLLLHHRGRLAHVTHKGRVDLVTVADEAAEALLVSEIAATFPDDRVIAEEGGARPGDGAGWSWLIDPLDGTTNYVHGLDQFAVSVGVAFGGAPVVGVVHQPAPGRTYRAATGAGAWLGDDRLQVAPAAELGDALLATGFPYDRFDHAPALLEPVERALRCSRGLRRLGAAALDLALVAAGTFAGFWEPRLKPWDIAAGAVLVREAGGRVTDFAGGEGFLDSGCVVASNGLLHQALLDSVVGEAVHG